MKPEVPVVWRKFLSAVDAELRETVSVHCLGGFGLAAYGVLERPTDDLDILQVAPANASATLERIGGRGSKLAAQYKLYIQYVGIADYPDDYETRLVPIHMFEKLQLYALEIHDLMLAKLGRNGPKDRFDLEQLAIGGRLNPQTLYHRYVTNLRPYLAVPQKTDLTLLLWVDEIAERSKSESRIFSQDELEKAQSEIRALQDQK